MVNFPIDIAKDLVPEDVKIIRQPDIVVDAEVWCDVVYEENGKIIEASSDWNFETKSWGKIWRTQYIF